MFFDLQAVLRGNHFFLSINIDSYPFIEALNLKAQIAIEPLCVWVVGILIEGLLFSENIALQFFLDPVFEKYSALLHLFINNGKGSIV